MGYFRMILALVVVYSHGHPPVHGFNIGVSAVVCFFIISGMYMAQIAPRFDARPLPFYADRLARILPQFWLFLAVAVVAQSLNGTPPSALSVAASAAVLPLGYYMYLWPDMLILAPAWSLGLEMTFYLLVPVLWRIPRAVNIGIALVSLRILAFACTASLQPEYFGYRLLPGTLAFFLAGAAIANPRRFGAVVPAVVVLVCTYLIAIGLRRGAIYDTDVLWGGVIGLPATFLLAGYARNWPFDRVIGGASYGVYLVHPIVMGELHGGFLQTAIISLIVGVGAYLLIDAPITRWRHARLTASFAPSPTPPQLGVPCR